MKPFWISIVVICALAGGGFYWWKTQSNAGATTEAMSGKAARAEGKGAGKRGGGPIAVRAVTVTRQPMPVVINTVGNVESEHSVGVRAQVNGVLESVMFKEGDRVQAGQVLFHIDARPAQASYDQVKAALARDEAQLLQAKAQQARLAPLIEKDYITKQEYDVAVTSTKSLEATVGANKAVLEQVKLQLEYTRIRAPIAGRTGSLNVKGGNLVTAGAAGAPLVVINSTQPILVSMSVPQQHLEAVRRYWNTPELKVQISPNRTEPVTAEGLLVFIDNTVNTQTGTVLLKARVRNEKEELWPGQFVAARIILRIEKDAVVLPESAVQPGQDRFFVYVVRDGKAEMQEVQVARQIGDLIVIKSGLSGGEQVVADVPPTLAPGAPVQVVQEGSVRGAGALGASGGGKDSKLEQAQK